MIKSKLSKKNALILKSGRNILAFSIAVALFFAFMQSSSSSNFILLFLFISILTYNFIELIFSSIQLFRYSEYAVKPEENELIEKLKETVENDRKFLYDTRAMFEGAEYGQQAKSKYLQSFMENLQKKKELLGME